MSYRAYHDYDDDRDVITCVTLSDTRPVARKEHTCGGCKKIIPVGVRHRAGSCSSTASRGTRRRAATASTTNPDGHAAGGSRGDTQSGHCWWLMLAVSLAHTADVASG
jgi:hypothetical protein